MQQSICQPRYLSTGNHRPVSVLVTRVREVKHAGETLSPSARLLLRSIVDYCGNESCCWPSSRRLAAECGLSIRQVRRLLRELEASGWIA
ncbi:MAG: helix-turn-helix domain-containing protein, partial [Planctomyces sp.]